MVSRYATELETSVSSSVVVISYRFQLTITSPTTGYIEALLMFQDGSRLSVFEFLRYSSKEVSREKYRYQLMDSENKEIFRYDNAPHHKSIASFPHHKHIDTSVYESPAPSLTDIIREIEHRILGLSP